MSRTYNESNEYDTWPDSSVHSLPNSDWSIGGWFYVPDLTGSLFQYIYSHDEVQTNDNLNIFLHEASEINFRTIEANVGFTTNWVFVRAGFVSDATWTHFILSRESGTLYLRQDYETYTASYSSLTSGCNPAGVVNIGRREDGDANRYFGGRLAEWFRVDRALTANQRKALANGASPKFFLQDMVWYRPYIRDDVDPVGGIVATPNNSPGVEVHPPIYYPE